jgi:gluconolactonase
MVLRAFDPQSSSSVSRRRLLGGIGAAIGAAAVPARWAHAQPAPGPVAPPSTVTQPPRDFGPQGAPTTYFTDPDVLTVDPAFDRLRQPNAPVQRLWTGALWSEGPAWNSVGRFLVWSDIPNNRQLRWSEDDGHVSGCRASTSRAAWCATSSTAR